MPIFNQINLQIEHLIFMINQDSLFTSFSSPYKTFNNHRTPSTT